MPRRGPAPVQDGRAAAAEKKHEEEKKGKDGYRESRYATFHRVVTLPEGVDLDKVEALDDYQVRVSLKRPSAPFLANIAFAMIVARETVDQIGLNPVGTGPFRFVERVPNSHVLVRRWEKFYVPGQPKVDEIRWIPVVENATRVANLKTGTADIVSEVIASVDTFRYQGVRAPITRGKSTHEALQAARRRVDALADRTPDRPGPRPSPVPVSEGVAAIEVGGPRAGVFLQCALTCDVLSLPPGGSVATRALAGDGTEVSPVGVARTVAQEQPWREDAFVLACPLGRADALVAWLRDLSDGYVRFDSDLLMKVDGPVAVTPSADADRAAPAIDALRRLEPIVCANKPFFIGRASLSAPSDVAALPEFRFDPPAGPARRTPLHGEHIAARARMVGFAGWDMPVWYTSIGAEHQTVRQQAGLFDLGHMGVIEVAGPGAGRFLDLLTANFVLMMEIGKAQYSYLLDPAGVPIDDILIYRRDRDRYMVVANAANEDRVKAWLHAVNDRACLIDRERPWLTVDTRPTIRDLKAPEAGDDRRIDIALQGPRARDILTSVIGDPVMRRRVRQLPRFDFVEAEIDGVPVLISRTGYTGEQFGYELYVHPECAVGLWRYLLDRGAEAGLRPIGLGARDSLRTEAGYPLYGHELAGPQAISPMGAGYGGFVKFHKPWFVGREAALRAESQRTLQIIRFRMREKGVRMVRAGDPVVDRNGECIGHVTSCVAVEGVQIGLAYVDRRSTDEGTALLIYPLGTSGKTQSEKARADLRRGDRVSVPVEATVIRRFR